MAGAQKRGRADVEAFVRGLLPSGDAGQSNFRKKVQNKVLVLGSVPKPRSAGRTQRVLDARRAASIRKMGSREARRHKLHDIPKEQQRYAAFVPLHEAWTAYARQRLSGKAPEAAADELDLTGCIVEVIRSTCPSLVGIRGIVVHNLKNMFRIITPRDRLVCVQKSCCEFEFEVAGKRVRINAIKAR